jgi:hypothetical protein
MTNTDVIMQQAAMEAGQRALQSQPVMLAISGFFIFCIFVLALVAWKGKGLLYLVIEVIEKFFSKVVR